MVLELAVSKVAFSAFVALLDEFLPWPFRSP